MQVENGTNTNGGDNVGEREEFLSVVDWEVVLTRLYNLGAVVLEQGLDRSDVDLLLSRSLLNSDQIIDVACVSCSAPFGEICQPDLEKV